MGFYDKREVGSFEEYIKEGHSLNESVAPAFNKVFPLMFDVKKISDIETFNLEGVNKKNVMSLVKAFKGRSFFYAIGDIAADLATALGTKKIAWNMDFGGLNGNTIEIGFKFGDGHFDGAGVNFNALLEIDGDNVEQNFYDMMRWWMGKREDTNLE